MKCITWKDIVGFDKKYQVSNRGDIRRATTRRILKYCVNSRKYAMVHLYKDGKSHTLAVHRIVATHFILNPQNKNEVNHKNKNRLDNNVSNLAWVTTKENSEHQSKTSLLTTIDEFEKMFSDVEIQTQRTPPEMFEMLRCKIKMEHPEMLHNRYLL
jgi:hypothetical protein